MRALGRLLDIPAHLVGRHPFPGPGLAIRILGEVTRDQIKILQHADDIYIEEIRAAGLYDQISQAFVALLPVKAVGVAGDARTYDQVVALRAVSTEDFMTADWFVFPPQVLKKISSRITNEVSTIMSDRERVIGSGCILTSRSKESTGSCMMLLLNHQERKCLLLFVVFISRKKADLILVLSGYKGNLACIDNASIWDDIPYHALRTSCWSTNHRQASRHSLILTLLITQLTWTGRPSCPRFGILNP